MNRKVALITGITGGMVHTWLNYCWKKGMMFTELSADHLPTTAKELLIWRVHLTSIFTMLTSVTL